MANTEAPQVYSEQPAYVSFRDLWLKKVMTKMCKCAGYALLNGVEPWRESRARGQWRKVVWEGNCTSGLLRFASLAACHRDREICKVIRKVAAREALGLTARD